MIFYTLKKLVDEIEKNSHIKRIYIWGTGEYGDLLGILLNKKHIEWYGYYDNYSTDIIKILNEKMVFSGKTIDSYMNKIYILSMRNYIPVMNQLLNKGVDEENIFAIGAIEIFEEIENKAIENKILTSKIKEFHNIHAGESCFVIGNGPSLLKEDLDKIYTNHMTSFASNSIYAAYDKTLWRPDYYVITDVNGIAEINNNIDCVSNNCKYLFSRSNGRLREHANKINNIILFKYAFSESEEQFSFSEDCSEEIYSGYTVTYAMLQLAIYMGFKTIYLLGVDHYYSKNKKNYSSLITLNNDTGFYLSDKTTLAYSAAKKYADEHKIKIYNATRGGKLEVFERADFDSLFEMK